MVDRLISFRRNFLRHDFVYRVLQNKDIRFSVLTNEFWFSRSSFTDFEFRRKSFTSFCVLASDGVTSFCRCVNVLELSADELRDELAGRYIHVDPKGLSKV